MDYIPQADNLTKLHPSLFRNKNRGVFFERKAYTQAKIGGLFMNDKRITNPQLAFQYCKNIAKDIHE